MRAMRFAIAAGLLMLAGGQAQASYIYNVAIDTPGVDLSGFFETNSLGTFSSSAAFEAILVDYSLTASINGTAAFTFTPGNSDFTYAAAPNYFGENVSFNVTSTEITISNLFTGFTGDLKTFFLIASTVTNGARENLRFADVALGYRTPNPPNQLVWQNMSSTSFVLASAPPTVTPEPTSLALAGFAGIGMAAGAWRRRRQEKPQAA